jgi:hypothetical protein
VKKELFWILLSWIVVLALPGPAWQMEWDQVVQAAKKEGKVAAIIPVGREAHNALTEPFQKQYSIQV